MVLWIINSPMRTTFAIGAALVLLAIAVSPVCGNESNFGVDDWTADDIAKHLKQDVKIDVSATAIAELGLQGSTLFAVADVDLSGLGLKPAELAAVRRSLVQITHRVNTKPADFWEWRAVNRRLFDGWIQPLAASPRALLIWMRFFDSNEAIEHINDEIDETNIVVFGLQWLFVPSYPIYQVVSKATDAHSYIDELAQFVYGVGVIGEVIGAAGAIIVMFFGQGMHPLIRQQISLTALIKQHLRVLTFAIVSATIGYYVLWWIMPLFITTIFFYIQVYFLMPLVVLGAPFLPFILVAFAQAIEEEERKKMFMRSYGHYGGFGLRY